MAESASDQCNFGDQVVTRGVKTQLVDQVFTNVAARYDLMNDLMSCGLHRYWKRMACLAAMIRPGQTVLDLASGTGDMAILLAQALGQSGQLLLGDLNIAMLRHAHTKLLNRGHLKPIYLQTNAEALPLPSNYCHRIMIAFGLRNISNQAAALQEMYRVLRPGGKLVILEFSHLVIPSLRRYYDAYAKHIIPRLGSLVAKDRASYEYLVASIKRHPTQAVLTEMLQTAGFADAGHSNLSLGIVALHTGYKY